MQQAMAQSVLKIEKLSHIIRSLSSIMAPAKIRYLFMTVTVDTVALNIVTKGFCRIKVIMMKK